MKVVSFHGDYVELLDQRELPENRSIIICREMEDLARALKENVVRGNFWKAVTASYGLLLDLNSTSKPTKKDLKLEWDSALNRVEPFFMKNREGKVLLQLLKKSFDSAPTQTPTKKIYEKLLEDISQYLENRVKRVSELKELVVHTFSDIKGNLRILILDGENCLSGDMNPVLEALKMLKKGKKVEKIYAESPSYPSSSSLLEFENEEESLPIQIVSQYEAANLMKEKQIDFVLLEGSREDSGGDIICSRGAYTIAVLASFHKVPLCMLSYDDLCQKNTSSSSKECSDLVPLDLITEQLG